MKKFALITLAILAAACGRIETGHVGVRTDFNKTVELNEVPPGWYGAVFTTVEEYTIKENEIEMKDMKPKAKDNLSLRDLDVSVFYQAAPDKVADLEIKYAGMSVPTEHGINRPAYNLVARYARGAIYDAVSKYDSLTIHTKRSELESMILESIQTDLDKEDPGAFFIKKIIVRQLITDPALEASIQQSVKVQKEIEAKNAQLELAKAEARRLKVEAEGQAVANETIARSITPQLVELRRIEAMQAFAGQGTHTVVLPANTNPLVNIK